MPEYDAVIAGGGLSGLSLAAQLAANGWGDRSVLWSMTRGYEPVRDVLGFLVRGARPARRGGVPNVRTGRVHAGTTSAFSRSVGTATGWSGGPTCARPSARCSTTPPDSGSSTGMWSECTRTRTGPASPSTTGRSAAAGRSTASPLPGPATPVDAWLAFAGWEVECARPVFDPATPVLFDFRTTQAGGSRFVYVLPDNTGRACGADRVRAAPGPPAQPGRAAQRARRIPDLRPALRRLPHHPRRVGVFHYAPIRPARNQPGPSDRRLGGSGQGQYRIRLPAHSKDSAAIAESLVQYGHPFSIRRTRRRYQFLDAVLLNVFDRDPPQLELAFAQLFEANPADRVLRFLDEDSSPMDVLRLMASLPTAPYLRALAHLHNGQ